jgi:hypothetical protein
VWLAPLALAAAVASARAQDPAPPPDPGGAQDEPGPGERGEPIPTVDGANGGETPAAPDRPAAERAPPAYRVEGDLDALFRGWLGSGLAERLELGTSAGGRPLEGLVFGGSGQRSLAERPTILLIGGLDGVSNAGTEAVLRVTDELLAAPERLPADVAFLAIPWANPDGLARQMRDGTGAGRNDLPRDEDGDGMTDEDGPDDLDGDGVITSLLVEDPDGPFARAEDDRLLRPARPGDAPRFTLAREGRDDDGDGRFNEDGPGGIVPDLDFPVDWRGPWSGAPTGPWPLASREARALADLVLERRVAIALLFQGNHGGLASPGGVPLAPPGTPPEAVVGTPVDPADRVAYEHVARLFASEVRRPLAPVPRLMDARGEERPGAALDWLYLACGVLALEVAPWGPAVDPAVQPHAQDAHFASVSAADSQAVAEPDARRASRIERAWAAWVDNAHGGMGFLDWQPVELGGGRAGWIGGWKPRTRLNPAPALLPLATSGLGDFVRRLAADVPAIAIEASIERTGGNVCVLKARVRNRGGLPTGAGVAADELGARLTLEVPQGAEVIVGARAQDLGVLAGGAASLEHSWVLLLPESASATLRVETPWLPTAQREVRP